MNPEEFGIWLCSIRGIGIQKIRHLVSEFGTPEEVFRADEKQLGKVEGISVKDAYNIVESRSGFDPVQYQKKLGTQKIQCMSWFSKDYPEMFRQLYDPPKRLFYIGHMPTEKCCIAVVGARNCSMYGKEIARRFSSALVRAGVGIVSGMARGIDGWAHQGALEGGGKTYAVLGSGADVCYPAEHVRLYRSICSRGGIISEYPPGTKAAPGFFPMRNRIISALSQGILVVEARKKSGSLITAELALNQGKDVFVIPGRVGDILSEGCNDLIRDGAVLVTEPEQILEYYGIVYQNNTESLKKINIFLESKEKMVYANLSLEPKHLNVLAKEVEMTPAEVLKCLLALLSRKLVKEIGNHYYIRNDI